VSKKDLIMRVLRKMREQGGDPNLRKKTRQPSRGLQGHLQRKASGQQGNTRAEMKDFQDRAVGIIPPSPNMRPLARNQDQVLRRQRAYDTRQDALGDQSMMLNKRMQVSPNVGGSGIHGAVRGTGPTGKSANDPVLLKLIKATAKKNKGKGKTKRGTRKPKK